MYRRTPHPFIAVIAAAALAFFAASSLLAQGAPAPRRAPIYIACLNDSGARYVLKQKPSRCARYGPTGADAGGVNLRRIHWRGWGGRQAGARAIEGGFHLPLEHIRAHVRVFRIRRCGEARVYTRLIATSRFGTSRTPRACPGPAF
jgi:hypothetical protein